MIYLISKLYPYMLLALLLGALVSWFTCRWQREED